MIKKRFSNIDKRLFLTDRLCSIQLFDALSTLKHLQNAFKRVFWVKRKQNGMKSMFVGCTIIWSLNINRPRPLLDRFAKLFKFGFRVKKPFSEGKEKFKIHLLIFTTTSLEQILDIWVHHFKKRLFTFFKMTFSKIRILIRPA